MIEKWWIFAVFNIRELEARAPIDVQGVMR